MLVWTGVGKAETEIIDGLINSTIRGANKIPKEDTKIQVQHFVYYLITVIPFVILFPKKTYFSNFFDKERMTTANKIFQKILLDFIKIK